MRAQQAQTNREEGSHESTNEAQVRRIPEALKNWSRLNGAQKAFWRCCRVGDDGDNGESGFMKTRTSLKGGGNYHP